jgi:hypothetical protein
LKEPVEAIKAYRRAIELRPDFPEAHCNLGLALQNQGHFDKALAALRRGQDLGSRRPGWRYAASAAGWVANCATMVKLDGKLSAVLRGESKPTSPLEALQLATLCRLPARRLHSASARLAAEAFAGDPRLADDLKAHHRYDAACSAARAAAGEAEDAAHLRDADRAELRRQTLAWLRADLAAHTKLLDKSPAPVRDVLQHWQKDLDFARLRDKVSLAELSPEELQAWRQLWADVAALLERAQSMSEKGSDPPKAKGSNASSDSR